MLKLKEIEKCKISDVSHDEILDVLNGEITRIKNSGYVDIRIGLLIKSLSTAIKNKDLSIETKTKNPNVIIFLLLEKYTRRNYLYLYFCEGNLVIEKNEDGVLDINAETKCHMPIAFPLDSSKKFLSIDDLIKAYTYEVTYINSLQLDKEIKNVVEDILLRTIKTAIQENAEIVNSGKTLGHIIYDLMGTIQTQEQFYMYYCITDRIYRKDTDTEAIEYDKDMKEEMIKTLKSVFDENTSPYRTKQ